MTHSGSEKPNIFIYKMTCDNGGAPCIDNKLISLSICKPRIRKSAKPGDWIIGMGGKSIKEMKYRLIYIMRVKECVKGSEYYKPDSDYWDRPDCIYEWDGTEYRIKQKPKAKYHGGEDELQTDVGTPGNNYASAVCLVGDEFAYFGDGRIDDEDKKKIEPCIQKIKHIYDELPRDYRKNHEKEVYEELRAYICYIMENYKGRCGIPTHMDTTKKCNETEGKICKVQCRGQ